MSNAYRGEIARQVPHRDFVAFAPVGQIVPENAVDDLRIALIAMHGTSYRALSSIVVEESAIDDPDGAAPDGQPTSAGPAAVLEKQAVLRNQGAAVVAAKDASSVIMGSVLDESAVANRRAAPPNEDGTAHDVITVSDCKAIQYGVGSLAVNELETRAQHPLEPGMAVDDAIRRAACTAQRDSFSPEVDAIVSLPGIDAAGHDDGIAIHGPIDCFLNRVGIHVLGQIVDFGTVLVGPQIYAGIEQAGRIVDVRQFPVLPGWLAPVDARRIGPEMVAVIVEEGIAGNVPHRPIQYTVGIAETAFRHVFTQRRVGYRRGGRLCHRELWADWSCIAPKNRIGHCCLTLRQMNGPPVRSRVVAGEGTIADCECTLRGEERAAAIRCVAGKHAPTHEIAGTPLLPAMAKPFNTALFVSPP